MTIDGTVSSQSDTAQAPGEKELYRELMEQFYEGSVAQYGADSEQASAVSELLKADAS